MKKIKVMAGIWHPAGRHKNGPSCTGAEKTAGIGNRRLRERPAPADALTLCWIFSESNPILI